MGCTKLDGSHLSEQQLPIFRGGGHRRYGSGRYRSVDVADLVVSGSEHRERATRIILPFQALFAAIFFASIGMRLAPTFLLDAWLLVLVVSVLIIVVKFVGVAVAAAAFKRPLLVIVSSGFVLAQIGEFSFILETSGRSAGLSPLGYGDNGSQAFIAVTVLLIALTPVLFNVGKAFQKRLEKEPAAALRMAPSATIGKGI